jgi:hypothetical protein
VTTHAGSNNLRVIDTYYGCPHVNGMARATIVCCCHVPRGFSTSQQIIMTTGTAATNVTVVYLVYRQPRHGVMACFAAISGRKVIDRFASCCNAIMTADARLVGYTGVVKT